jgi:hypothetical protein
MQTLRHKLFWPLIARCDGVSRVSKLSALQVGTWNGPKKVGHMRPKDHMCNLFDPIHDLHKLAIKKRQTMHKSMEVPFSV